MSKFLDILGTSLSKFQIAIGGVILKNSSGNLLVRNPADNADASITTSQLNNSGDVIVLNSDAAGSANDWKVTLSRPSSGMSAHWIFTVPTGPGTANQVLQTDGNGNTSWASAASTTSCISTDTTSLAFGSGATVGMFTLPANAVVETVRVIIDTPFNGTPSLSVGISGTTSKYLASTQVDLTGTAGNIYEVYPGKAPVGTSEALIASYSPGDASVGAARIEVDYTIPA